jgi:CHRD domain-containing protein
MGAMIPEEPQGAGGISRRKMLRRMGAGITVAWTAPILTSVQVPAYAQVSLGCHLSATMDGLQETPPNGSPGTGTADFFRTAPGQLSYTYQYQNLVSGVNACHIHKAPPGTPGGIVIPLSINPGTTSGSVSDTAQADPVLLDDICANPGEYYINLHTDAFPGGEIRGQLQPF